MIKSIKNEQWRNLKFLRHDDYFDVFPDESKKLSTIIIRYKGYSPKFYSNSQGILLCGYFPYYPMEGYRPAFLFTEEGRNFNTSIDVVPKKFDINIKSKIPIYSNLDLKTEVSSYHFSGTTKTLTLMGGFIKEQATGSTRIYTFALYPNIELDLEAIKRGLDAYCEQTGIVSNGYSFKKVFYLPNTIIFTGDSKESSVLLDDYLMSIVPNNTKYLVNNITENRLEAMSK